MPIRNAKYAANFVQRTRRLGSIATESNAMYVLFGFLDNHSRVYKIFQRVRIFIQGVQTLSHLFEQLRRKILFIVRLQLVMRRNHAQKQCLRAVAAKRALQLATKADFSFFVRRARFLFCQCTILYLSISHTTLA